MKPETLSGILSDYATFLQVEKAMVEGSRAAYVTAARELLAVMNHHPESLLMPREWDWPDVERRAVEMHLNTLARVRNWRPNTQALRATALRAFFRFLETRGYLDRNPARSLKPTLPPRNLGVPPGEEEAVRRLFAGTPEGVNAARLQLLLELFYGGMLRPGQVYRLRALEVKAPEGPLRVRLAREVLEVPLSPAGLERVERYLALREAQRTDGAGKKSRARMAFWVDATGRACSAARMAKEVAQALRAAGLVGGGAELRLLAARHFRERGGDTRSLRQLMRAKRLGDLDRYGQTDFKSVAQKFRQIHPRQSERD